MIRSLQHPHSFGDDCPGGHYASPGSDGSCCQAAQDTEDRMHAWNCRAATERAGEPVSREAEVTAEINADPVEVERLRKARRDVRAGKRYPRDPPD